MIRICSYCLIKMGEKEPFEDKRETHGICDLCYEREIGGYIKRKATKIEEDRCNTQ